MNLQDQVCTIEQAKKLRELGVKQESYFMYAKDHEYPMPLKRVEGVETWSCFSVSELGIMLPDDFIKFFDFPGYVTPKSQEYELSFRQWFFKNGEGNRTFGCRYDYMGNINISTGNFLGTEAQARAALLIHLIENNLVTVEQINKRLS